MKSAGKARDNGLYRHIRTSKEIIRNLLNDLQKNIIRVQSNYLLHTALNELFSTTPKRLQYWWCL